MSAPKLSPVPKHYGCNKCFTKLEEAYIKVFDGLLYCGACHDAVRRRAMLLAAEKEFDESPDETIE